MGSQILDQIMILTLVWLRAPSGELHRHLLEDATLRSPEGETTIGADKRDVEMESDEL